MGSDDDSVWIGAASRVVGKELAFKETEGELKAIINSGACKRKADCDVSERCQLEKTDPIRLACPNSEYYS